MNLSIGDGIAVAGCAASLAYTLRYTVIGWVRSRAWVRAIKSLENAVDKIIAASRED